MRIPAVLGALCYFAAATVRAGDAVVVGYNSDGMWTTVTYYSSATPKSGADYKSAAQARATALRDLRRRGQGELVRESVLSDSDATGYVAVARGKTKSDKDVIVVGRGKTQGEADKESLEQLKRSDVDEAQKIFYRFHSYGADSN